MGEKECRGAGGRLHRVGDLNQAPNGTYFDGADGIYLLPSGSLHDGIPDSVPAVDQYLGPQYKENRNPILLSKLLEMGLNGAIEFRTQQVRHSQLSNQIEEDLRLV